MGRSLLIYRPAELIYMLYQLPGFQVDPILFLLLSFPTFFLKMSYSRSFTLKCNLCYKITVNFPLLLAWIIRIIMFLRIESY